MVNENKNNVFAAVAGAVVGAGAVIAGAVALADKKNQKKVSEALAKGQKMAKDYVNKVNQRVDNKVEQGKNTIKKVAGKAIKSAEKATMVAKSEVRKI